MVELNFNLILTCTILTCFPLICACYLHVILRKAPALRLDTCCVPVINTYFVHDWNGLDAYTSYTVYEQDSLVVSHKRINYMFAILCGLYSIILMLLVSLTMYGQQVLSCSEPVTTVE